MQIEKNLPQFNNSKSLIVAAGDHDAKIYSVFNGIIKKLELFCIPNPCFTDREGFVMQKIKGKYLTSGAVYTPKKEYLRVKFLTGLRKDIKNILRRESEIKNIYLFAPEYIADPIIKSMPVQIQEKIKIMHSGNYELQHPFKLLNMIKEKEFDIIGESVPLKEEARKLLSK